MDLRLITYFVAVADAGSATKAAAQLHVTQPVLSRQLRHLEHELGLSLFERDGRRLRLTRSGETFLVEARGLLRHADEVERTAHALAAGQLTEIALATATTTLSDVVTPFLATLAPQDPMVLVRDVDPAGARVALEHGADLVLQTRPPEPELSSRCLAVVPLWCYVPPSDPWAARAQIDLAELGSRPVIVLPAGFGPRRLMDQALKSQGITLVNQIEASHGAVAQAHVAAGRGVAVVSDDPKFGLVGLRIMTADGLLTMPLYAAWESTHHGAQLLESLAVRLAEFCVERYGDEVRPVQT